MQLRSSLLQICSNYFFIHRYIFLYEIVKLSQLKSDDGTDFCKYLSKYSLKLLIGVNEGLNQFFHRLQGTAGVFTEQLIGSFMAKLLFFGERNFQTVFAD